MAQSPASGSPEITGNVMFYKQPEPLSLEKHRLLGVKRVEKPYNFLVGTHVVPITTNEFPVAAGSYPIIFAGEEKAALAVMGARAGENLFVSPDGEIDPEAYIPAFVRRYPFVFAVEPSGERMLMCIDRAAPIVTEGPEIPFFNGDQPSQYTQDAIEFCKEYERIRMWTLEFVKRMNQLDLWEVKTVSIAPNGVDPNNASELIKVAEYYAISEDKLNALPNEQFLALRAEGWLPIIYAHMVSLLLWPKILSRTMVKAQPDQQQFRVAEMPRR